VLVLVLVLVLVDVLVGVSRRNQIEMAIRIEN
jgi:hypothetical protein